MSREPFKALSEVHEPDARQLGWVIRSELTGATRPKTLAEHHAAIAEIELPPSVPVDIANQFQTAKHVLLYAWFVYRFITVAELHAYACLEWALRERFGISPYDKPPSLSKLLKRAVREGLLSDAGFPSYQHGLSDAMMSPITGNAFVDTNVVFQAGGRLPPSRVEVLAELLPKMRNMLAHGSPNLWPGGYMTLQLVAEAITQLFPAQIDTGAPG